MLTLSVHKCEPVYIAASALASMSQSLQHSPDGAPDSILSESAQLRSALQAKTYLQALSPAERRRLLRGTKVSGQLLVLLLKRTIAPIMQKQFVLAVQVIDASTILLLWLLPQPGGMSFSNCLIKRRTGLLTTRLSWHNNLMSVTVQGRLHMR